jgi:hypothetical protein
MKRPRVGIRSTRKQKQQDHSSVHSSTATDNGIHPNAARTNANLIPNDDPLDGTNNIFCYAALADKQTDTLYTDATGSLPARSLDGNQSYLVAYDYDTNYIFAVPVDSQTDEDIINAFENVFGQLKDKGYKTTLNVTDNQAANSIKKYLKRKKCRWQFVEPSNHRVNAAERAIQTFKNHFISGLCLTDTNWPIQLWDQLTTQALITLNLLRTSRIDPTKSAYHQLHGHQYDWNKHPLAPPATRAVIYNNPDSRTSWGPIGTDTWYCGPALDHYRNCRFYVPATRSYRTLGSFNLFPQHCLLPEFTPTQHTSAVHDELIEAIQRLKKPARAKIL